MSDSRKDGGEPGWERQVLERLVLEALAEQRRSRRWGVFFRLATLICVVLGLWIVGGFRGRRAAGWRSPYGAGERRRRHRPEGEASAERVVAALQSAFADSGTEGVVLRINSPGGSPVQAGMINDEIVRLRGLHPDVPVYAVVEDICASGGYYVAAAADRILWTRPASSDRSGC
jgi:protease-4